MMLESITAVFSNLAFPVATVAILIVVVYKQYTMMKAHDEEYKSAMLEYKSTIDDYAKEIKEQRAATIKAIETIDKYSSKLDIIQHDVVDIKNHLID